MNKKLVILTALTALILSGCAVLNFYKKVDSMVAAGKYKEADALVDTEKKQYAGHHELLYYFDKGSLLQMLGDYKGSTQYLEKAELKIESLYTKSATQQLSSFLTNDMNLPYEGEDFEQVMVNVMKSLNFMYEGNFDGARIEARKVNNRLNVLSDRYEGQNIYKEDPFARYLSAIAFEAAGTSQELNHAYIDYKKSYETYKEYAGVYGIEIPHSLKEDILRTAHALYRDDDVEKYKKEFGMSTFTTYAKMKKGGEAIIVIYDGMAPYKKSVNIKSPTKDKDGKKFFISVAFPKFVKRGYVVNSVSVNAEGAQYPGSVAEDISRLAYTNLEHKNGLIAAKAIARATAKYLAARAISDNGKNSTLNLLTGIYNLVSEQADTRSWRTLPARFHIVRIPLEKGKHTVNVVLDTVSGSRTVPVELKIYRGRKTVVPVFAFQ